MSALTMPVMVTYTVTSTGQPAEVVAGVPLLVSVVQVHLGLKGDTGDVNPAIPGLVSAAETAAAAAAESAALVDLGALTEAVVAAEESKTEAEEAATQATLARDAAIAAAVAAATSAAEAALVGSVVMFAMNAAPDGWLKANGALVSRTTYAALFSRIGTTYGAGDGATTFGLPDMRGEFPRGWDDGRGVDAGRGFGSAQGHQFQSHEHRISSYWTESAGSFNDNAYSVSVQSSGVEVIQRNTTQVVGGSSGAETRPRNVAMLACIKF